MASRHYKFKTSIFNVRTEIDDPISIDICYSSVTDVCMIGEEIQFDLNDVGKLAAIFTEIANVRGIEIPNNIQEYRVYKK